MARITTNGSSGITYAANDLNGSELHQWSNASNPVYLHRNDHVSTAMKKSPLAAM